LTYEHEQQGQVWAGEMKEVLLGMHAAACQWRERGATRLPALERDEWVIQYFDVLALGFAAQPPTAQDETPKRRGRRKQTSTKNLLDDLLRRAGQVLAFLDDLSIPFTKYLVWYTHSQHRLDEVTGSDVYWFLADWFPKPRLVGFPCQHEEVSGFVREILQTDARNRSGFSPNRC
jgi:hypothetical protein